MPLNPEYQSAFEQDEARRREETRRAEAAHAEKAKAAPRTTTDAQRQHAHAQKIREETADRARDHARAGYLDRVSATPPLNAEYRNGQLALSMTPQAAQGGTATDDSYLQTLQFVLNGLLVEASFKLKAEPTAP